MEEDILTDTSRMRIRLGPTDTDGSRWRRSNSRKAEKPAMFIRMATNRNRRREEKSGRWISTNRQNISLIYSNKRSISTEEQSEITSRAV